MKKSITLLAVLMSALFLASCSTDKVPAEEAIKAADSAFDAVKAEALRYVPAQAQEIEAAINTAKDSLAKKEYTAALNSAKDLASKAQDLAAAVAAKKEELTRSWGEMSSGIPKILQVIQSRVEILGKSKKLPAGLDKAKFEGVKSGLAEITQTWNDASAAFQSGNLNDALAKAKIVKEKAGEALTALGMNAPTALKK